MLSAEELLATLRQWAEQGWLRRLDAALPALVLDIAPHTPPALLLSVALLSHLEGQGHTCLPLQTLHSRRHTWLAWPPAGQTALDTLWPLLPSTETDWRTLLVGHPCVRWSSPGDSSAHAEQLAPEQAGQPSAHVEHLSTRAEHPISVRAELDEAPATADAHPLVLADAPLRLYLRRHHADEQVVAHHLRLRSEPAPDAPAPPLLRPVLDQLFGLPNAARVDWQRQACALALRARLGVITGGPGTGKTYTAARLLATVLATAPDPASLRIALAAPTGKAAARLKLSIADALLTLPPVTSPRTGEQLDMAALVSRLETARTLHAWLGARPDTRHFARHAGDPLAVDVMIVDEASMIHLEMMAALLDALPPQARLVLLGDKEQLASVEAGAVLGDLCQGAEAGGYSPATAEWLVQATGQAMPAEMLAKSAPKPLAQLTVMLRESRRFNGPIGQLALAANRGDAPAATHALAQAGPELAADFSGQREHLIHLALQGRDSAPEPGGYARCLAALAQRPTGSEAAHQQWVRALLQGFERFRLLCATREGPWGVSGLNDAIQQALAQRGLVRPDGLWWPGRPVMVTRNEPALGVFNGDIGLTLPAWSAPGQPSALKVWFAQGDELRAISPMRLPHTDTAFAMTVHKSQGSEFGHTVLVLPDQGGQLLSRELIYTGITRARQAFTLVCPQRQLWAQALENRTQRASGLGWVVNAL
ncbi:MAG: exodeoxyribonuclease V subunit alpha [Ideonella sp. MAG2]|nr:MAG: exodeoxyribonuclease V subunit alpha [Ideonella sp. MAG2]